MARVFHQASATSTNPTNSGNCRACLCSYLRDEVGDGLAPPSGASFQELTDSEQSQSENTCLGFYSWSEQCWYWWYQPSNAGLNGSRGHHLGPRHFPDWLPPQKYREHQITSAKCRDGGKKEKWLAMEARPLSFIGNVWVCDVGKFWLTAIFKMAARNAEWNSGKTVLFPIHGGKKLQKSLDETAKF